MRIYSVLLTMFLFLFLFSCHELPSEEKVIYKYGLYSDHHKIIKTFENDHKSPEKNFLLGVSHNELKQFKKSILFFANSCFETHRNYKLKLYPLPVYRFVDGFHFKSDYYDEAVYEIAKLFYSYREYKYVIKFIELIDNNKPGLFRDAVILKTRALSSLKRNSEALETLRKLKYEYNDSISQSLIQIRIASVYREMKNYKSSIDTYFKIIARSPSAWQSSVSSTQIDNIIAVNKIPLSTNQQFLLAEAFNRMGSYKKTDEIIKKYHLNRIRDINILKLNVRNNIRLGKRNIAINIIQKHRKNTKAYNILLKEAADELSLIKKTYMAIPLYKKLINSNEYEIACDSLRRLCNFYEDRRRKGYINYLELFCKRYPKNINTGRFLWLLGKNSIRDGKINKAEYYLKKSVSLAPSQKYTDASRFWLYKITLNKKNLPVSHRLLLDLVTENPDSSYAWILIKRECKKNSVNTLQNKFADAIEKKDEKKARFYNTLLFAKEANIEKRNKRLNSIFAISKKDDPKLEAPTQCVLKNLESYFRIGYMKPVFREISILPESENEIIQNALGYYSYHYGNYNLALNSLIKLYNLKKVKIDISIMPNKNLEILFPLAFKDQIDLNSKKFNINRFMILSLIKAESSFNSSAVSPVGAAGLMQLMPPTAQDIARKLNTKEYDLKDEEVSIKFGTYYISWLGKYFNNNFSYMVAGYNAGAGNVNKWKRKFKFKGPDYFTEFVPFDETRYYILKTNKYLVQYETIYGGQ